MAALFHGIPFGPTILRFIYRNFTTTILPFNSVFEREKFLAYLNWLAHQEELFCYLPWEKSGNGLHILISKMSDDKDNTKSKNKKKNKNKNKNSAGKKRSESLSEETDSPASLDDRKPSDSNSSRSGRQKQENPRNGQPPAPSNGDRRNRSVFQHYMSREDVDRGLKRGQLFKGELRINPRSWEEAYVPHPDGHSDVFLEGVQSRNRALNTDLVVVRLLPRSDWRVMLEPLNRAKPASPPPGGKGESDSDDDVIIESETTEMEDEFGNKCTVTKNFDDPVTSPPTGVTSPPTGATSATPSTPPRSVNHQTQATPTRSGDVMENPHARNTPQRPDKRKYQTIRLRDYHREVEDKFLQKTGQVVYIYEKCHSRASCGILKPMADRNPDMALFCPADNRVPRICLPMKDCPEDFRKNPDSYSSTLCVARIIRWDEYSKLPTGELVRSLGEAGDIDAETEGVLMAYDVDYSEFPQSVLDCLPETPWSIPEAEMTSRKDLRGDCIFTIDPASARDLDDALSCKDLGNGVYEVGVHIADVSYFLHEGNELDKMAAKRATSVYLIQKVIPMLPRLLCEQLCSLNADADKLTFSVIWKINEQGQILNEWFGRTVIRSRVKLSYQHAQKFIDDPGSDWTDELPEVETPETAQQVKQAILNLHKLAVQLRSERFTKGALRLEQDKLSFTLDKETGLPCGCSVYTYQDSNKLIEEFMLLANMAVAHKLEKSFPDSALLRRHPEPQTKMMDDLVSFCDALGIKISGASSEELQRCLSKELGDGSVESRARFQVLTQLCTRPMQFARYFCTGSLDDVTSYRHYALNVPLYTHFTSPIRRYADVIVHRQLAAALGLTEKILLTVDDIEAQARKCNLKKNNSKRVQEFSSDLFFSIFIKESGPLERVGMVMAVLDRSFDVFVPAFGVVKRVYCDKLGLTRTEFHKKENVVPELVLYWNKNGQELRQEVRIFSSVWCVLQADQQPLKWQMLIKSEVPA